MKGLDILLNNEYVGKMCPSEMSRNWQDMCENLSNDKDTCLKCWKLALDKDY